MKAFDLQRTKKLTQRWPTVARLWEQWEALYAEVVRTNRAFERFTQEARDLRQQATLARTPKRRAELAARFTKLVSHSKPLADSEERLKQTNHELWEQMIAALIPILNGPEAQECLWLVIATKEFIPQNLLTRLREACPGVTI